MENQLTSERVEKTPEQIEAEMFQTRESLTEKVNALENQVLGTVQTAANTLTDTVDAVKSFVHDAPEAVSETVEQVTSAVRESVERTFDISSRVQSHPWGSIGVAAGVGFLTGYMAFQENRKSSREKRSESRPAAEAPSLIPPSPATPRQAGVFDDLLTILSRKAKEMTETAIDAAAGAVTQKIREGMPRLVEEAAKRFVNENHEPRTEETAFDAGKKIYGR